MNRGTEFVERFLVTLLLISIGGCGKQPIASDAATTGDQTRIASPVFGNSLPQPNSAAELARNLTGSGDQDAAEVAMRNYVRQNPESFTELSALVHSGDPRLAALGAKGLAALASAEAAADLIAVIQTSPSGRARRELSLTLAGFNNRALASLFLNVLAISQEHDIVLPVQQALANTADTALLTQVVQNYEASNSVTERQNLADAVRYMQNVNCVEGLMAILDQQRVISTVDPLALAAIDTLGVIGSPGAVNYLFTGLQSEREETSSPLLDSIGRVRNPDSLPLLTSVANAQVSSSNPSVRLAAIQALGNFSEQQVQSALNWLSQNDPSAGIRAAAAAAIERVKHQ